VIPPVVLDSPSRSLWLLRRPWVCGVSSLGIDHTQILGDTIEKIAWQKGGIFKVCCPCSSVLACDWSVSSLAVIVSSVGGSCLHGEAARRRHGDAEEQSLRDEREWPGPASRQEGGVPVMLPLCCSVLCGCVRSWRTTRQTVDLCVWAWPGSTSAPTPPWPSS